MSTSLEERAHPAGTSAQNSQLTIFSLLLATVFWGMGFTWAKAGGERINFRAGMNVGAALGPVLLLSVRFTFGAILWLVFFPASRRSWTWRGFVRGALLGCVLAVGLISQHLGLDRTSEAVSAFLTNLTVIFVPLIVAVISRKWPAVRLSGAIAVAAVGIYLMTGAAPQGFGLGELLGLTCSILFSIYIVALDHASVGEDPFRLTAVQFLIVGCVCLSVAIVLGRGHIDLGQFLADRSLIKESLLLTTLTTVGAFGLMMRFQPKINPTRAALIYLAEPVVASVWAWLAAGRMMSAIAIAGAILILAANVLAGGDHGHD